MYARSVSASFCVCFLEENMYLSSVRFQGFLKACLQVSCISRSEIVATLMCGNLSAKLFRPVVSSDEKSTLTIFLAAACSFQLLMSPAILGFCSVTSRKISFTEIEYFALAATINRSHQSSHSVLGAISAVSQNVGSPATDP